MTRFYVVRHGQTDFNKEFRIQGTSDIPLNETGLIQAKDIAIKLSNVNFDAIYYSPLIRARQTATEIFSRHPESEFIEAPEIVERNFGEYEGEVVDVNSPNCKNLWNYDLENTAMKGGESMDDMKRRIFPFLDKLLSERDGQTLCVVCHGGVVKIIREYFYGTPVTNNLLDFPQTPNGEAVIFER